MTTKPKILVTGGAGFVGSHTVAELQKAGHEVLVLDNLSTGFLNNVSCPIIVGDVGDERLLNKIFSEHKIDAVLHFAGSLIVEESVFYPQKYFKNNSVNTLTLLSAMVRHNIKKFIFSSTAAVYGDPQFLPIKENHPCNPTNPYGETKLMTEKIIKWFVNAHDLSAVVLRYFNAAGASIDGSLGDRKEIVTHLIPRVLKVAAREEELVKVFGTDYPTTDGTAVRDYIHVQDLAKAHVLGLKKLNEDQGLFTYNVGTGQGHSVSQVIDAAVECLGKMIPIQNSPRRAGDSPILVADASMIKADLGFTPLHSGLDTIIKTAWQWHLEQKNQQAQDLEKTPFSGIISAT